MIDLFVELLKLGYKVGGETTNKLEGCEWNVYKRTTLDAPDCLCNDRKPQILICCYNYTQQQDMSIFEISLTQRSVLGWVDMKYYGIGEDELLEKLDVLESSLIRGWSAL